MPHHMRHHVSDFNIIEFYAKNKKREKGKSATGHGPIRRSDTSMEKVPVPRDGIQLFLPTTILRERAM